MKTKSIHTLILGIGTFGTMLLASCQAPPSGPKTAVSCDKCHTIHYMAPSSGTNPGTKGIVTLRHASSMSCPDCENKVVALLKSGSVTRHSCASCGGTLHHCTQH
ncbi:MAG: hypothetical protein HS117_14455 [Verrucomicrobiaceae bacterium]|nr:hypothetical protein [Verrucomicrobiaceae bacterium]